MKLLLVILAIIIIKVLINIKLANYMVKAAELKGYGPEAKVLSLVYWTGTFGCLYVIALPDLVLQRQNEQILKHLNTAPEPEELPEI